MILPGKSEHAMSLGRRAMRQGVRVSDRFGPPIARRDRLMAKKARDYRWLCALAKLHECRKVAQRLRGAMSRPHINSHRRQKSRTRRSGSTLVVGPWSQARGNSLLASAFFFPPVNSLRTSSPPRRALTIPVVPPSLPARRPYPAAGSRAQIPTVASTTRTYR
jgi:hypothetical protein